jgi:ligand-binding SRPBCC domain-containing protein
MDGGSFTFSFETHLKADARDVWAHASSFDGVNRELWPLARMTSPPSMRSLDSADIVPGKKVLRSWILAFGVVPIDYDDLVLVEVESGRRFLERSSMLSQRVWEHERTVDPARVGSIIRDRIRFEPRIAALGYVQMPIFRMVFANRHRQLARIFGRA